MHNLGNRAATTGKVRGHRFGDSDPEIGEEGVHDCFSWIAAVHGHIIYS
jgi:hypothetical protein